MYCLRTRGLAGASNEQRLEVLQELSKKKWKHVKKFSVNMASLKDLCIETTEMHTGGEPLRIVQSGFPEILGETILDKRRHVKENFDEIRKFLLFEPRGHADMYGAILLKASDPRADIAVIFMHNEGYSTMCGHAVIALARYAVDKGIVKKTSPETQVNIECPCGVVPSFLVTDASREDFGRVRFQSVAAFVFAAGVRIHLPGVGDVVLDVAYGGAFYAMVDASRAGLSPLPNANVSVIRNKAAHISEAVRKMVVLSHPDGEDLAFLYGVVFTEGTDEREYICCIFADSAVDRSPCGSGVTARIAQLYHKGSIALHETRRFVSALTGSEFEGAAMREALDYGNGGLRRAGHGVHVEVSGRAFYTGTSSFTSEPRDPLAAGFLVRNGRN